MANKVIGFTIDIEGIKSLNDLNAAIKQTTKEMNALDTSTEEYAKSAEKLAKLKAEQASIRKQQADLNKSFREQSKALGSYDQLSNKLNRLRKEYKDLAVEGKGSTKEAKALKKEIDELDKTLKKVDGSVGQFQRNVGNYPKVFNLAGRGLRRYAGILEDSEGKLGAFGVAAIGAFVAFKAGGAIFKAIGELNKFNKELESTQQQLRGFTGASGDELDALTVDINALSKTFDVDSKTIIDSAKQISEKTGVSFDDAIKQIENGLVRGTESSDAFLSNIAEYPEAYANAGQATGAFADKQRELLSTNKELVDSQINSAQRLAEFGAIAENLGNNVKTFLIDTFLFLYDNVLKPLYNNSIKPLVDAFSELFASLGEGSGIMDLFGAAVNLALTPLKIAAQTITLVVNGLTGIIKFGRQAGEALGIFSKQTDQAGKSQGDFSKQVLGDIDKINKANQDKAKAESLALKQEQDRINAEKKRAEEQKKIAEEQKQRAEQAQKDRQKFIEDESKYIEQQAKIQIDLQQKTQQLITDNLKNEFEKRRVELKTANEKEKQEIKDVLTTITDEQKKREDEALKLFGKNSTEYKTLVEQNAKTKEQVEVDTNRALTNLNKQYFTELDKINNEQFESEEKLRFAKIENERKLIQQLAELETLKIEEQYAKGLISEKEYQNALLTIQKGAIEKELQTIGDKKFAEEDVNNQIIQDKQKLNTELAKLQKEQTDNEKAENQKRVEDAKTSDQKKLENLQSTISQVAEYTQQVIGLVNQFADIAFAGQLAKIDDQVKKSEEAVTVLEEQLQNATGLQARYLEEQINNELKKQEEFAKEKERIETEQKKAKKATAIIESIINTAVAVTANLANPVLAAIVGVLGAIQTAAIAAQPLAEGGVAGILGKDVVQFNNGGRVTSKGNIKPLSNGDNVLATLKTGEVVLNKSQQSKVGYSNLKRANIPNFANGGVVGAPSSLIADSNRQLVNEQMRTVAMENTINAVNSRIDRIQVVYTATTDQDIERSRSDQKLIKANASF